MPVVIDGYNFLHAMRKAGYDLARSALCSMLDKYAQSHPGVTIVFDGAWPRSQLAGRGLPQRIDIQFAAPETADHRIIELIDQNTAPRRLTVVSTDKEIRKAARRRRCPVKLSEDFAEDLLKVIFAGPPPPPTEPPEKRQGLAEENDVQRWMREFGIDDDDNAR